jgi:flagellar biosynthesis protein FlhB
VSASEERTEEATPRRRAKSHAQGINASSALVSSALALGAAVAVAAVAIGHARAWLNAFRAGVSAATAVARHPDASTMLQSASAISNESGCWQIIVYCWMLTTLAAVAAAYACGSLGFAPAAILPGWNRLTTRMGLRRLVNGDSFIQTVGAFAAVVLVVTLLSPILFRDVSMLAQLRDIVAQSLAAVHAAGVLWWRALIAVALVAVIDVIVQRRKHSTRLRMSPRELREERAQTEGRPEARQRRRSAGLRRVRDLRIDAIRRATAVVANPTHVAVALRYAPPKVDVPVVVARGAGLMVPVVRAVAVAAGVPIVESPELARMLYANVDVDEQIPEQYYAAVAAIFTWIIRTRGALRRGDEDGM